MLWRGREPVVLPLPDDRALDEYDELGQDRFLEKYGFRPARSYYLVRDGRRYDSKAICGVAFGYQFPERGPLRAAEFHGGNRTVRPKLEELGFEVFVEGAPGEDRAE